MFKLSVLYCLHANGFTSQVDYVRAYRASHKVNRLSTSEAIQKTIDESERGSEAFLYIYTYM